MGGGGNFSGVTPRFGIGSRLELGARTWTRLRGIPVPRAGIQAPQSFHLVGRASEARTRSAACPESHGKPEQSAGLMPTPLRPSRSCPARTPTISSAVSWVPETQHPALPSGPLRPATVASPKICPLTPRTPLRTVCQPPPCPAATPQSLARGPAPPTVPCPPGPPGPPARRPRGLRPLWP